MRKRIVYCLVLSALLAGNVLAAQYAPIVYSLGRASRAAQLILAGRVSDITQSLKWKRNTIAIEEWMKGKSDAQIIVKTSAVVQAGPYFKKEERCILFLYRLESGEYAVVFD